MYELVDDIITSLIRLVFPAAMLAADGPGKRGLVLMTLRSVRINVGLSSIIGAIPEGQAEVTADS